MRQVQWQTRQSLTKRRCRWLLDLRSVSLMFRMRHATGGLVLTVVLRLCLALLRTPILDGSLLGCGWHVVVFGLTRPLFVRGTGPLNIRSPNPPIRGVRRGARDEALGVTPGRTVICSLDSS